MVWATKPQRTIEEVMLDTIYSQYPPYRPYQGIRVRFKGDTEFTWQRSLSAWAVIST